MDSHPFLHEKMGNFIFAFGIEKGEGKGIGGKNWGSQTTAVDIEHCAGDTKRILWQKSKYMLTMESCKSDP